MGDRRFEKAITDCQLGGIEAAVSFFKENTTPQLIVFETELSGDTLLEQVARLAEVCDEGTEVLALGSANDVQTYRSLVSEGVNDYIVGPFNAVQIFNAIEAVVIDPDAPPRGRIRFTSSILPGYQARQVGRGASALALSEGHRLRRRQGRNRQLNAGP